MHAITSKMMLNQLELDVNLGWPEAERLQKQKVILDVHIHFIHPPEACTTDELDEKTNYEILSQKITTAVALRTFRLVEYLGQELYQLLKGLLPEKTLITLCITKYPPIANLKGGVYFWYGDTLPEE